MDLRPRHEVRPECRLNFQTKRTIRMHAITYMTHKYTLMCKEHTYVVFSQSGPQPSCFPSLSHPFLPSPFPLLPPRGSNNFTTTSLQSSTLLKHQQMLGNGPPQPGRGPVSVNPAATLNVPWTDLSIRPSAKSRRSINEQEKVHQVRSRQSNSGRNENAPTHPSHRVILRSNEIHFSSSNDNMNSTKSVSRTIHQVFQRVSKISSLCSNYLQRRFKWFQNRVNLSCKRIKNVQWRTKPLSTSHRFVSESIFNLLSLYFRICVFNLVSLFQNCI
jgi:hypothetical protein